MSNLSENLRRLLDWLRSQGDVRRGAILGIGFGLILCVVMFIAILLVTYSGTLGK